MIINIVNYTLLLYEKLELHFPILENTLLSFENRGGNGLG